MEWKWHIAGSTITAIWIHLWMLLNSKHRSSLIINMCVAANKNKILRKLNLSNMWSRPVKIIRRRSIEDLSENNARLWPWLMLLYVKNCRCNKLVPSVSWDKMRWKLNYLFIHKDSTIDERKTFQLTHSGNRLSINELMFRHLILWKLFQNFLHNEM
jgi:hypothetical protein